MAPLGVGVPEFRAGSAKEHSEVLLKFVFSCADVTHADVEPTRLWCTARKTPPPPPQPAHPQQSCIYTQVAGQVVCSPVLPSSAGRSFI